MSRVTFVPYPPTSFPFRDLLVLEQMAFGREDKVCEIGVGSGATTARLAQLCGSVTGFEISEPTVEMLRYLEEAHPNLRLIVADVTKPETTVAHAGQFTRLISCDTLEHVADPGAYFEAVSRLLAPGGRFFITFPNEPPEVMHGITRFESPADVAAHLARAGLVGCQVGAAKLTPGAERVAETLGWRPLRAVRSVVQMVRSRSALAADGSDPAEAISAPPQTFEGTNFYKNARFWRRVSPVVNLYWYGVLRLMAAKRPSFFVDWEFREIPFRHAQIVVVGSKPTTH